MAGALAHGPREAMGEDVRPVILGKRRSIRDSGGKVAAKNSRHEVRMSYVNPGEQIRDTVGKQIKDTVGKRIKDTVGEQIKGTVGEQIKDTVGEQIKDAVGEQIKDEGKVGAQQIKDEIVKQEIKGGEVIPIEEGKLVEQMMGSIVRQAVVGGSHLLQTWLNRRGGI